MITSAVGAVVVVVVVVVVVIVVVVVVVVVVRPMHRILNGCSPACERTCGATNT